MNAINKVADFVAMPLTARGSAVIQPMLVFLALSVLSIVIGEWLGLPTSVGWIFGYGWGALSVYGAMRKR